MENVKETLNSYDMGTFEFTQNNAYINRVISFEEVKNVFMHTKNNKAYGIDKISNLLIPPIPFARFDVSFILEFVAVHSHLC